MASSDAILLLAPGDNVAVVIRPLAAGTAVVVGQACVSVERDTAVGHKIADVFTEDNPKGFDRERFFKDALIDNT